MQRKKMSQLLEQCIYLNRLVEYEAIHSFQEFMRNLEEVHFKRLKEEGLIQEDGGYEMEMQFIFSIQDKEIDSKSFFRCEEALYNKSF